MVDSEIVHTFAVYYYTNTLNMLKICNLTFAYRRKSRPVLDDFSLEIGRGGVYGLLGRNGAGKSTLLYLIAGALTPSEGHVLYQGIDTRRRLPETLSDIFMVSEEFTLPAIKLKDYVKANAPFYPRFSEADMQRHLEVFDMDPDVNLGALSMGQKKKVYMSFALACNTPLILMDEPTNGLDIPGKSAFRRFIAQNMNDDRSIIISTHQVRDIDSLLDHVVIMNEASPLLNESVIDISRKLKFTTTDSKAAIESDLYAKQALGGSEVILPNTDDEETELNLETLFEFAISNPEKIKLIFTHKSAEQ